MSMLKMHKTLELRFFNTNSLSFWAILGANTDRKWYRNNKGYTKILQTLSCPKQLYYTYIYIWESIKQCGLDIII